MVIFLITGLQAPNITLTAEGTAETGSKDYSLLCVITIPSTISNHATPTISWRLPSGTILSSDQDFTRLPFTPLTSQAEDDYTCTAYYTVGGVRSPEASKKHHVTVQPPALTADVSATVTVMGSPVETRSYIVTVQTPAPTDDVSVTVTVTGSGSGEVGSLYTLTCTVILSHRASDSSVSIQWQGPGLSHTDDDDDDDDDSTDNRVVVSELSLNPLTLGHVGDYTCTAQYSTVDGETVTNSGNITLNVLSKLMLI